MNQRKFRRKTRKMVLTRYDNILKSMKKTGNDYGVKRIPLNLFRQMLDKAKFSEELENENLKDFAEKFNKTIEMIWQCANDNAKIIGDNCISFMEVKQWVDACRAGF